MFKGDYDGLYGGLVHYSRSGLIGGLMNGLEKDVNASKADTTSDGKQVIWVIGDSKAAGVSTAAGPAPIPGTAFQFNLKKQIVPITDTDIIGCYQGVGGTSPGSQWPQYCRRYYEITGHKAVIVPNGVSGTSFNVLGDTINWSTSGPLYEPAKKNAKDCLAALGLQKLRRIIVILGVNDVGSAPSSAVLADVDSLFERLDRDFPGVKVLVSLPGRHTPGGNLAPKPQIRFRMRQLSQRFPNMVICINEGVYEAAGLLNTDNVHWNYNGNQVAGNQLAEYERGRYNKYSFSIINSYVVPLTQEHQTLIDNFVKAEVANGNFFKYNMLLNYKTEYSYDVFNDMAQVMMPIVANTTMDFVANDGFVSDGISKVMDTGFRGGETNISYQLLDSLFYIKIGNKTTASGVATTLGGTATSSNVLQINQRATPDIAYRANDVTVNTSNSPDTSFQANSGYGAARNGGTKYFLKNGGIIRSDVVAATNLSLNNLYIGGFRSSAALTTQFYAATYKYVLLSSYSDFNYPEFVTNMETLHNNW